MGCLRDLLTRYYTACIGHASCRLKEGIRMKEVLKKRRLENILFLDIETVSCTKSYQDLSDALKELWDQKAARIREKDNEQASSLFFDKAAIYAEFGKVIVIGLGFIILDAHNRPTLRVKALHGHNEKVLLQTFAQLLETRFQQDCLRLCAHNGKEFDFPYLCRRMMVHGIPLPTALDMAGKKPWEVPHLDTLELWKFGDRKSFTSLHLLATLFGIGPSKAIMQGNEVNHYYYIKNDLDTITTYCKQDVVVTVQVFLRMNYWELISSENILLI